MVTTSSVLYVKHLPPELSPADKEELLKLAGAVAVKVMPDQGRMKHCAFATFQTHEDAKFALSILHQKEILGKRLNVEYACKAHENHISHLSDQPEVSTAVPKEASGSLSNKDITRMAEEEFSIKLHGISPTLGLNYFPSPLLKYKYPPPTPTVISNISHALVSVPKFYTQVLHLMNKMNLPAPFGPLTPQPPITADPIFKVDQSTGVCEADILGVEAASEESESEYETEEDGEPKPESSALPLKRPSKIKKKRVKRKMVKPSVLAPSVQKPRTEPSEVFESLPIVQKKISMKKIETIPTDEPTKDAVVEPTGGFGAFEAKKENKDDGDNEEASDDIWSETKFISSDELRRKRISSREMKTLSIFKNYSAGEPTIRLYIKNLARQVEEKDLRFIFGRYVDRSSEVDKNMFDVKLMKEGRMKGQAFVTLATEEQAKRAVSETNGFVLHTKPMVVQFARSAKPKDDKKNN